ncbi:MAG: PAS domain S-box protein [Bacteroidales bacterium]|nr:PAS domain S-box protein [Bacteroidales bacterium]
MKLAEKFLRNNFILLVIGIDAFYVVVFFIVYLLGVEKELSFNSLIDVTYNNVGFILLLVHPFLLTLVMYFNSRENVKYNKKLEKEIDLQRKKMEEINSFVEDLRLGRTGVEFSQQYQQDKLVRALLNMRDDIEKTRQEDNHRQIEEQQRHWVNQGLARFGTILQENVDNLEKLTSEITSNLTKYVQCQQAGFFVVNEQNAEKSLDMIALFAYDRKKFADKKFMWGEGLIGACAIEQKTIFLKETSENFVDITSGLGKSNPRALIIVPVKDSENVVHGVIELASFKIFEDFEISFIEQVAESIGLTIATIKTSLRTQELLKESQKQAEMLAQQDETMRRNIEEIEKEREESELRALEFERFSNSVNQAVVRVDIDLQGSINFVNDVFLELFNYETVESIKGQKFSNILEPQHKNWFIDAFDQILESGEKFQQGLQMLSSTDKHLWLIGAFVPILNAEDEMVTIMFLGVDRTDIQIEIGENTQAVHSFANIALKADFNIDGNFICASPNFYETMGQKKEELLQKTVFDLIPSKQAEQFKIIWSNISKGKEYKAEQALVKKDKTEFIVNAYFSPVKSIDQSVMKISMFASDITEFINVKSTVKTINDKLSKAEDKLAEITKESVNIIDKTKSEIEKQYKEKEHKADIFETLFQAIDDGLVVLENENIVVFNSVAEQLWGLKKDVTIGKKVKYLFSKDDSTKDDKQYLGNVILKGVTESIEEKQMYILDREMKKMEIFARIVFFELDKSSFTAIFLKQIK